MAPVAWVVHHGHIRAVRLERSARGNKGRQGDQMRSMRKLSAVFVAAGLIVTACGGDDDDRDATPDTEETGDETPTDETEPEDTGDDGDDAPADTTVAPDDEPAPEDETGDEPGDEPSDEPAPTTVPDDGSSGDGAVCTEDKKGGELVLTSRGVTAAFDPAISVLSSTQTGGEAIPFYSVLFREDMETGEYVPHVAEGITSNDDLTEWTVKLREGVTFGNGDPLDAAAFLAHLERHLGDAGFSRIKFTSLGIVSAWEAVSDMEVKITLNFPWAQFPGMLAGDLGMVQNTALVEERGGEFGTNPVGGGVGPYELVEYSPPERVVLEAKDDWWGGPVCIERLTYTFIPDLGANYDAFTTGEIDSLLIARDPVLIKEAQADNETRSEMYNAAFVMMPNSAVGHTTDVRVRQAMAYAIDPEVINARAWGGEGWGGKGIINSGTRSLEPTEGLPYDPDMATQLLDEYKAETGWDGTITGVFADSPASNQEAALAAAAMLDAVGFNVQTTVLPINDLITQVAIERNFELVLSWGIINGESNLYPGLRSWESTNPGNQSGFASEAYDAALVELRVANDPAAYQAALESLQAAVNEDVPYIVYGGDLSTMVWNPAVKGGIPFQNQTYLLDNAFIEE